MIEKNDISFLLLKIFLKFSAMQKEIQSFGTDQTLHGAEISMINAIEEQPGIHVTGLAQTLGVTKGAVSQILQRLEKKGMIVKKKDSRNLSRLEIWLSEKGKTACGNHRKRHKELDTAIDAILAHESGENIAFLNRFLKEFKTRMDEYRPG